MTFDLSIPYIKGPSVDLNDNMNGYYKDDEEYVTALIKEDNSNGQTVFNKMSNRGGVNNTYYAITENIDYNIEKFNEIEYANAKCILMTPDGMYDEDVDSIIDKFASQKEFLVMAHFQSGDMDGEFEEEIKEWAKETFNILLCGKEISNKSGSSVEGDTFIENNIPRRDMKLSFRNKSGRLLTFLLSKCEIEKKINRRRREIVITSQINI